MRIATSTLLSSLAAFAFAAGFASMAYASTPRCSGCMASYYQCIAAPGAIEVECVRAYNRCAEANDCMFMPEPLEP